MTKTHICMDNCGFQTVIEATSVNGGKIKLNIKSDCKSIQEFSEMLTETDPFQVIGQSIADCIIHQTASKCLKHLACIVPSAVVRTIEVESGMALPGKATISVEKE